MTTPQYLSTIAMRIAMKMDELEDAPTVERAEAICDILSDVTPPAPERSKEEVVEALFQSVAPFIDGTAWREVRAALSAALEPASPHKGEDDGSEAAAIEIADAVIAWMVKYDLLDADLEYRDDDIIAVLDDLAPEASPAPLPVTITDEWLRDTAMNVMLATEVEEAMRTLSAALAKPGEQG